MLVDLTDNCCGGLETDDDEGSLAKAETARPEVVTADIDIDGDARRGASDDRESDRRLTK